MKMRYYLTFIILLSLVLVQPIGATVQRIDTATQSYAIFLTPSSARNTLPLSASFSSALDSAGVSAADSFLFGGIGVGGIFNLTPSQLSLVNTLFHPYLVIPNHVIYLQSGPAQTPPLNNWSYFPGGQYNGTGVKVAVIDTGINSSLSLLGPSFASRIAAEFNFVNPGSPPDDIDGHGTSVASIIAADSAGFKGVAPGVQLLIYKVFRGNETTSNLLVEALDRAAQDGASVINLSLGGGLDEATLWQLGYLLYQRGIELVASVGNTGPDLGTLSLPAALPYFMSVGATTSPFSDQPVAELSLGSNYSFETAQPMQGSPMTSAPIQGSYMYVGSATPNDTQGVNLSGKIAVALRDHRTTFAEMEKDAAAAGALGLVVVNDENSSFLGTLITNASSTAPTIPVVSVAYQEGYRLLNADPKNTVLHMYVFIPPYPYPAPFSSRGPAGPFSFKPEIVAPGDSVPVVTLQGLGLESGTSFSAPQVSGALALLTEEHPGLTPDQYYSILELSASQLERDGVSFPPYVQGAGELNITKALHTPFTVSPGDFVALYPYPGGNYSDTIHVQFFTSLTLHVSYLGGYPLSLGTNELSPGDSNLTVSAIHATDSVHYDWIVFSSSSMNYTFPVMITPSAIGVSFNSTDNIMTLDGVPKRGYTAEVTYPDGSLHNISLKSEGIVNRAVGTPLSGFYYVNVQSSDGNGGTVGLGMFYIGSVPQPLFPGYAPVILVGYSLLLCVVTLGIYVARRLRIRRAPQSVFRQAIGG